MKQLGPSTVTRFARAFAATLAGAALVPLLLASPPAAAQAWPSKPIRVIVPHPPTPQPPHPALHQVPPRGPSCRR